MSVWPTKYQKDIGNYQNIKNMLYKIFKDYFLRNFFKNENFCK